MADDIPQEDEAALAELAGAVGSFLSLVGFDPALLLEPADKPRLGGRPGLYVEVDALTGGAGVYVGWHNSKDLTEAVIQAARRGDLADPVLPVHGDALRIMFEALVELLSTAGFVVSEAEGYREYQVRVEGIAGDILETVRRCRGN